MASEVNKSAANSTAKQFYKPGRKVRATLSCDQCRSRKLKCNRELPCQNCILRCEQTACKYRGSKTVPMPAPLSDTMQQRINRLEGLVNTLLSQAQTNASPGASSLPHHALTPESEIESLNGKDDESAAPFNLGTTVIDGGHSVYRAADNWSDLLQEVNELKNLWNQSQEDSTDIDPQRSLLNLVDGSSFLSGQVQSVNMSELLSALPPKAEVDKLILQYFDNKNFAIPTVPVLHEPAFMREYNKHWNNLHPPNIMWLGLLFSILGITMLSYHMVENEPPEYQGRSESLYELYRLRTAQCLMKGDIAKCLPYTLETLLLNSTAELARRDDNARGLWMMTGVMVRAAISMGYHREPSQTSSISVLQGELRRRIWCGILGKDYLASFLVGFPTSMPDVYSDAQEPRNLYDWELTESTTILPPSRPVTERTSVTYLIVKGRLMHALGEVTDFNNKLNTGTYKGLLEIDKSLHAAYQGIPPHMKAPINTVIDLAQSKCEAVSGLQMEYAYHRAMCSLHRKYHARGRVDSKYSLSRDRCVSSARAMLEHQQVFDKEQRAPGALPYWYKITSARQFCILSAMMLCLEMYHRQRDSSLDEYLDSDVLLRVLNQSCTIWRNIRWASSEAKRVYQVLNGMLLSFNGMTGSQSAQTTNQAVAFEAPDSIQPIPNSNNVIPMPEEIWQPADEMDIDWAVWDSIIEGGSLEEYQGISLNDINFDYNTI